MYLGINKKFYFLGIFLISLLSLIIALYIEYVMGIKPCRLCLYQRIPYLISLFISFLGYMYIKRPLWIYLSLLVFFLSVIISGYHVGIENGIFEELKVCKNNLDILSKEDLLNSLKNQNIPCKEVPIKLFGLSLATINLILSLTVVVVTIVFLKYAKNK
tara:strand:- start:505 stop:981 length:477 start_codon:yes stop_codon:yes gene_type:complete